jgi:hypothetical protein
MKFAAAFVVVVACAAVVATARGTRRPTPILTGAGETQTSLGFGEVRPREVYLGGDESGAFCGIHWLSWGGQFAIGTGTGWWVPRTGPIAAGHEAPGVIVLHDLGMWQEAPAYQKLTWYFPQGGSTHGGVPRCRGFPATDPLANTGHARSLRA